MTSGTITTANVATAPMLTTAGTEGTNFYTVTFTGGTLNVNEWDIRSVSNAGVQLGAGVTLTTFDNITWSNTFQTTGGTADSFLNVTSQTATLTGHTFPATWTGGECAVRLDTSGTLTMTNVTGAFSGDANDCDAANSRGGVTGTGIVSWGHAPRHSGSSGYPAIY